MKIELRTNLDAPGLVAGGDSTAAGVSALLLLVDFVGNANEDFDERRCVAKFLLGLKDGHSFPFALTSLRAIDRRLFKACVDVLQMNTLAEEKTIWKYLPEGGRLWVEMRHSFRVPNVGRVFDEVAGLIRSGSPLKSSKERAELAIDSIREAMGDAYEESYWNS